MIASRDRAAEVWGALIRAGGLAATRAFYKVWFQKGKLTPEEEALLQKLYLQEPLGTPGFKAWYKQRVRQVFENMLTQQAEAKMKFGPTPIIGSAPKRTPQDVARTCICIVAYISSFVNTFFGNTTGQVLT